MNLNNKVYYDKENDILSIHKGFSSDEKFKGNIDVGKLILDVSTQGKIRGIEIMDATKFFKEFNINEEILEDMTNADFNATINPNSIIIGIVIKAKNIANEIPAKIAVHLETPILAYYEIILVLLIINNIHYTIYNFMKLASIYLEC